MKFYYSEKCEVCSAMFLELPEELDIEIINIEDNPESCKFVKAVPLLVLGKHVKYGFIGQEQIREWFHDRKEI